MKIPSPGSVEDKALPFVYPIGSFRRRHDVTRGEARRVEGHALTMTKSTAVLVIAGGVSLPTSGLTSGVFVSPPEASYIHDVSPGGQEAELHVTRCETRLRGRKVGGAVSIHH